MNPVIAKNFVYFPIQSLMGLNIKKHIEELSHLESKNYEYINRYKNQKINLLLKYAYNNIPFYNQIFKDAGINLSQTDPLDNLHKIPILTKTIVRENISSLIHFKEKMSQRSTSGTTGSPLTFFKDSMAISYLYAMANVAYAWHGIHIGDKQARFWGSEVNLKNKIIQKTKDRLQNRRRLSAFNMSEKECIYFYKSLTKFKPNYFYGYANALYQFASTLSKKKIDSKSIVERVIISTGEVLYEYQRQKIEDVFNCKVVNEYGSTESGIIGFECDHGRMHVLPTVHVDIINQDNNGYGEIIVTELNSRAVPFIKYKIGDKGKLISNKCPCNRPYEILDLQQGRTDDYILLPNGNLVYDAILAYTLKDYVLQFKAFQREINKLDIFVIHKNNFNSALKNRLRVKLQKFLTKEMDIQFIEVQKINIEKSGKFRYFVSEIQR